MDLRRCRYCGQSISTTAFYCPACRKADEASINWLNSAKRAAKTVGLFGIALFGPNAIVGAILGPELNRPTAKTVQRIAAQIRAVDSIPIGFDRTVFFTCTGFVPMFLYDLGRDPDVPHEVAYGDLLRIVVDPPNRKGDVEGYIEYRAPRHVEPPRRPKPIERLVLGKDLYDRLIAEADEFSKHGPPKTLRYEFSFSGSNAETYASFLQAKFEEYASQHGNSLSRS